MLKRGDSLVVMREALRGVSGPRCGACGGSGEYDTERGESTGAPTGKATERVLDAASVGVCCRCGYALAWTHPDEEFVTRGTCANPLCGSGMEVARNNLTGELSVEEVD